MKLIPVSVETFDRIADELSCEDRFINRELYEKDIENLYDEKTGGYFVIDQSLTKPQPNDL